MTERVYFPQPILPSAPEQGGKAQKEIKQSASFAEILNQHTLKFSRHAQERIAKREISLDAGHLQRINTAVEKAAAKGAHDSLILVDNLAFVVSIKNRTVITALDEKSLRGNVFTNIDSAVII
ncbi:MAG: TIGR02530 family flagellar biosynthesis protein [Bacillota bacterium]|nr:TIGR02530 family flagellar biosynthesis protein [Bacillota bacterium]